MAQDFPANPLLKDGYILDFSDEFDTLELDTSNWIPYYLPQWSSKARTGTNYRMTGESLVLVIDEDQQPWSPEFNGDVKVSSLQTGVYSGELHSSYGQHKVSPKCIVREVQKTEKKYTPRYGYFEIRAKAIKSQNNVCAFWMIGFEDTPDKSGEICLMEIKGENINDNHSINGHGIRAFADPKLTDTFYEEAFQLDARDYHIYAAEWKPDRVDFYIDNKIVKSIAQSPAYEMQFMLNIYEVPIATALGAAEKQYPKEFEIDYVRAYQPQGGY